MKIFLTILLSLLITGFTALPISTLSTKTLMSAADRYDGQVVEVMGIVEKINRIEGSWHYGYYHEIQLYLNVDKNFIVLTMTPAMPIRLHQGDLIKVKGKFHKKDLFDKYTYENFIEAEKIISLEAA